MTGKKKPQFQGVRVFDADDEYIVSAMAEHKGMDLIVYANVPADPALEPLNTYTISSTAPEVTLIATFQRAQGVDYFFADVKLAR